MKKYKKQLILDWISIYWVSFCAFFLCLGYGSFFSYENYLNYSLSIFFSTALIYSLARIKIIDFTSLLFHFIFSILSIYFLLKSQLTWMSFVILMCSFILSLLYISPFKKLNIRNIPSTKSFLVSFIWIIVVTVLPSLESKKFSSYLIFSLFCLILANILIFDLKERRKDSRQLKTIPQLFGIKKSILLNYSLLVFSFLFISISNLNLKLIVLLEVLYLLNMVYIFFYIKHIQKFVFSIFLDAFLFFAGIILLFVRS